MKYFCKCDYSTRLNWIYSHIYYWKTEIKGQNEKKIVFHLLTFENVYSSIHNH